MREIKFRCYGKESKKWFYYDELDGRTFIQPDQECSESFQYTGLKDLNGKEIYEGDLVKYDYNSTPVEHCLGKVYWENEGGCWKFGDYLLEPTIKKTLEIIGNIYENKDLLKEKQNG